MTTTMATSTSPRYTVPGMSLDEGAHVAGILQGRLDSLNDLALTLKHVHWNVVGPNFIAVHEMIDPQVDAVRGMVDEIAERIATLGVAPSGTPGVVSDHRAAAAETDQPDPVTNDMLVAHLASLELFHWFIRAHLETPSGAVRSE